MIYTVVTKDFFINELLNDDYANWTYDGAKALYEYLELESEDLEKDIEFDRISLRCEFNEYVSIDDVLEDYQLKNLEQLQDETTVIQLENGHVIIRMF